MLEGSFCSGSGSSFEKCRILGDNTEKLLLPTAERAQWFLVFGGDLWVEFSLGG